MIKCGFPLNLPMLKPLPKLFMVTADLSFFPFFFLFFPWSSSSPLGSFGGSTTNTKGFSSVTSSLAAFREWWLRASLTLQGKQKTHTVRIGNNNVSSCWIFLVGYVHYHQKNHVRSCTIVCTNYVCSDIQFWTFSISPTSPASSSSRKIVPRSVGHSMHPRDWRWLGTPFFSMMRIEAMVRLNANHRPSGSPEISFASLA